MPRQRHATLQRIIGHDKLAQLEELDRARALDKTRWRRPYLDILQELFDTASLQPSRSQQKTALVSRNERIIETCDQMLAGKYRVPHQHYEELRYLIGWRRFALLEGRRPSASGMTYHAILQSHLDSTRLHTGSLRTRPETDRKKIVEIFEQMLAGTYR